ncbi:hypothetical protein ES705_46355 [subsurface metagenome]
MNNHSVFVDYRGTGKLPFCPISIECPGIKLSEVFAPKKISIDIIAIESFRGEEDNNMLPVGYRAAVGMGCFGVASNFGYSGKCLFLPDDLTTVLINAVYLPVVY